MTKTHLCTYLGNTNLAITLTLILIACSLPWELVKSTATPKPTETHMPPLTSTATPRDTATPAMMPAATPIQPTPAPATPSPTPVPLRIITFIAEPVDVDPGSQVHLAWEWIGSGDGMLEQHLPASLLGERFAVSSTGSTTVTIGENERLWHEFRLVVSNASGETTEQSINVRVNCPYDYFFGQTPTDRWGDPESCPYKPAAYTWAAEQVFQGGRMIWLEAIPGESTPSGREQGPTIYVLYGDGTGASMWERYDDTWDESQLASDPEIIPPAGTYQPIRGFGKVWRQNANVRERLGWALSPEQGFNGAYQVDWRPYYLRGPIYLGTLSGSIARLGVMGIWELLP